jgi:N-methylhydantoinase A/oxoprolinase/acetone carboxylase beta subunit
MGIGRLDRPNMVAPRPADAAPARRRKVHFDGKPVTTAIVERAGIKRGGAIRGPAIIEEPTATTILPPGWGATIAAGGHMLIARGRGR